MSATVLIKALTVLLCHVILHNRPSLSRPDTSIKAESMTIAEPLIGIKEVAERLSVSTRTVQRWIIKKGLPVCKPGRSLYFYWSDVSAWMKENRYEINDVDSG